jgi:hypothetical protein
MAHVYVRSGAGGSNNGSSWANAYTALAAALTAKAAGDQFWVSEDHAETQGSAMTLTCPGTIAAPSTIACVTHTGTVPPVSADLRTTATITVTGGFKITYAGAQFYYEGITFSASAGSNPHTIGNTTGQYFAFKNCNFIETAAAATVVICQFAFGSLVFDNCAIEAGSGGNNGVTTEIPFHWKNTATPITGSANPDSFIVCQDGPILLEGLDMSSTRFSSASQLVKLTSGAGGGSIKNCKLRSGAVPFTMNKGAQSGIVIVSDSGATNYRHEKYQYVGSQIVEATIVRTGGATDGTTPVAWKIVTTADSSWYLPFECIRMAIWNDTTASNVTVTVYGVWGGGAVPNNDDIWIEVNYLGSSSSPIATFNSANTKADILAAAAGQSSDGSTWGGSTTAFKMAVTLSSPQPAMKGPIYVTVKAAKASSTFYVDPKIVLS